ncbi:hypothetical protein [Escherichia coli]|uniref:hypothetical protein n=1 Tax=Escherichia coli TaxID=562 RepID=UPI003F515F72
MMLSSVNDFFQFSFGQSGSLLNLLRRHPHFLKLARNGQGFLKRSFLATFLLKTFCNRHAVCSAPADKKTRHFAGLCGSHQ